MNIPFDGELLHRYSMIINQIGHAKAHIWIDETISLRGELAAKLLSFFKDLL